MARSGTPDGVDGQQSLGDLVALAAKDVSQLIRYEINLAKSELRMDARRIGLAAALAAIAMFVGCLVIILVSIAAAYGLVAGGIPHWAAFLIVAFIWVVLGVLACLIAYFKVRRVTGMKMTRQTISDDLEMLRRADGNGSPNGSAPAVANPDGIRGGASAELPAHQ